MKGKASVRWLCVVAHGLLAICLSVAPANAQTEGGLGDVTLRFGFTRSTGLWTSAEVEIGLSRVFAATLFAKDIDDRSDCLGVSRISPCTADGRSLGGSLRVRSVDVKARGWWPYLEGLVGAHRYRQGDSYFMLGGATGVGWFIGPRGTLEAAIEVLRISASLVDQLDYATVVGKTHRTVGGLTLRIGVRVG